MTQGLAINTTEQAPVAPSRVFGAPDADSLTLINRLVPKPLDPERVFTFEAILSTDALDAYGTRMARSTLENFVRESKEGRALMNSHRTGGFLQGVSELPIGRSYDAEIVPVKGAEGAESSVGVAVRYYMLRGHVVEGQSTDEYIRGVEGGVYHRMSVGFTAWPDGRMVCDQDGIDWYRDHNWECPHWPGLFTADGGINTFTLEDHHKREGSLVYLNATPGSLVARAEAAALEGRLADSTARLMEAQWGVRGLVDLGASRRRSYVLDPARGQRTGGTRVDEQEVTVGGRTIRLPAEVAETVRAAFGEAQDRIAELEPLAEMGRSYRADLIERARAARVGAGETFNEQRYAARLETFDADELKEEVERCEASRAARFPDPDANGSRRQVPARAVPAGTEDGVEVVSPR